MPFHSANLKALYEELRDIGVPITGSQVARLYSDGQLETLLSKSRNIEQRITFLVSRITTLRSHLATLPIGDESVPSLQTMIFDLEEEHRRLKNRWDLRELFD